MTPAASEVSKLSVKHRVLYYDGRPVTATSLDDGLSKFLNWLKAKKHVLLLAHNAKSFDAKHLFKALASCGKIDEFCQIALGFSDTLPAFRELYPDRKSFSQQNLATDLLSATYNAHSALDDVQVLQKLSTSFISDAVLLRHSFSNSWLQQYIVFLSQKSKTLKTLQPLIHLKKASKSMADKISASGLSLDHLQLAYSRGGVDGLTNVLTEKFQGKPRVSTNKRVIKTTICSYFQNE
ncbi:hypothetical protein OS493_012500 [Desmophyllum pertusum]|uniref:Exonuclease domain-containing protein n=1 Tax=Desmophyllum pertusum TaxID=174260 RepID=A0A9W9ZSF4_9CNID|nr:hypothetical protein OS493_012500 [Desmophyllum pertusum]